MPSFYPTNDAEFSLWLGNFVTVANANLGALGLVAADITALQALKTDLDARLAAEQTARDAAVGATAAKNTSRRNANVQASFRGKVITANPNISNALKESLGLNVRDGVPSSTPPVPPTALSVETFGNGVNRLKWDRAANKPNTQYLVECKVGGAAEYAFVAVTTKTKFDHANQLPGVRAFYRVRAARGGQESGWSNDAVAYAGV